MKTFRAKILAVVLMGAGVASIAYSQTAPKDILPQNNVPHPPVSPTLNVLTPDNVPMPSPVPTAITPQASTPAPPMVPQLLTPGVVETNKLQAPANGEPVGPGAKQSLWTQTNAAPSSAWGKIAVAGSTSPSVAKPAPDLWSTPPPTAHLWDSTIPLGSSGTKTDWK
jgi:hypothetical protein